MKNLLLLCVLLLCACSKKERYEYKIVHVTYDATDYYDINEFMNNLLNDTPTTPMSGNDGRLFEPSVFVNEEKMLNEMTSKGWEYVDVYTETSTVFPNFGNEKYVTGIVPNTRTSAVNYIFKRIKIEDDEKKQIIQNDIDTDTISVVSYDEDGIY